MDTRRRRGGRGGPVRRGGGRGVAGIRVLVGMTVGGAVVMMAGALLVLTDVVLGLRMPGGAVSAEVLLSGGLLCGAAVITLGLPGWGAATSLRRPSGGPGRRRSARVGAPRGGSSYEGPAYEGPAYEGPAYEGPAHEGPAHESGH